MRVVRRRRSEPRLRGARSSGEGVGHGDEISAGGLAHRRQFDVDVQLVAGDDWAVLLEDFFGLYIGVVIDDHRFEHAPIAGHARRRHERQRRRQVRVAQLRGGGDISVRGVIVLHATRLFAQLLTADQVGVAHLVGVADPGIDRGRLCCCGHECAQLFCRLVVDPTKAH
jgi:hypothetical protein